ncbi:class I SAM-dependent methyltransferase [Saccharopolyspora endophytica]|uniref:Class I SAM-dependent methyltransferase n=1 Tax=Saccharopolyspora endophytica TaxID=543886 RepID=A0ABS5DMM3_9PSEU|nr:class I SAM-dependent methyltransferase [Saccharopolyspora endophytica]MBQ0927549.1 class I SAM-dependent methyltransferase [Saccharopolyspora endophytica]
MNRIESMLVNSPPRRWLQRYEARELINLGGRVPGGLVAELGCGPGYGTRLILDRFGAAHVDAVDLDPAMIARARKRLARHTGRVHLAQGSATDLRTGFAPFGSGQDASYDAVFDFAIIHHIPNWRDALAEVARVLKPGGRFYFDEVTATALARPTYQRLFDHPTDNRFTAGEFLAELPRHGLTASESWRTHIGGDYLLGVATRT